jgi:hypothetical protein
MAFFFVDAEGILTENTSYWPIMNIKDFPFNIYRQLAIFSK